MEPATILSRDSSEKIPASRRPSLQIGGYFLELEGPESSNRLPIKPPNNHHVLIRHHVNCPAPLPFPLNPRWPTLRSPLYRTPLDESYGDASLPLSPRPQRPKPQLHAHPLAPQPLRRIHRPVIRSPHSRIHRTPTALE